MSKSRKTSILHIKIKQGENVFERSLRFKDRLTIGKNPKNDIVVAGRQYPKKHILFECDKKM